MLKENCIEKVSVIIPNYNHAPFLEQRINSILNQTYKNFEVILLDDCSIDISRDIFEKYRSNKRIKKIIFNNKNSGSTFKQWQLGLEYASGKYIWIAESDDYSDETFIEKMVKNITMSRKIGLVYCQSYDVTSSTNKIKKIPISPKLNHRSTIIDGKIFLKKYMVDTNSIPNVSSVLFRKRYLEQHCRDAVNFRYAGDWIVYIKILCASDIYVEPEFLNYFRSHDQTTRSNRDLHQWISAFEELLIIQNLLLFNKIVHGIKYQKNIYSIIQDIHLFRDLNFYFDFYLSNITGDICIYCTSSLGLFFFTKIKESYPKINVKFFIDKKAEKGSYVISDKNVYSLDQIRCLTHVPFIFIASIKWYDEIAQELTKANLQEKILNTKY